MSSFEVFVFLVKFIDDTAWFNQSGCLLLKGCGLDRQTLIWNLEVPISEVSQKTTIGKLLKVTVH